MSKSIYSYIRKEYECYKNYTDSTIKKLLPNWCSVLKSIQNDVKKEYEDKLRWIPVEEKLPPLNEYVLFKYSEGEYCVGCLNNHGYYCTTYIPADNDFSSIHLLSEVTHWRSFL